MTRLNATQWSLSIAARNAFARVKLIRMDYLDCWSSTMPFLKQKGSKAGIVHVLYLDIVGYSKRLTD